MWVCLLIGFLQQLNVLNRLAESLKHGNRFVQVNWHGKLGKILANEVFQDGPSIPFLIGINERWKLSSLLIIAEFPFLERLTFGDDSLFRELATNVVGKY